MKKQIKLFIGITAACLAAILMSVCGCFSKTDSPPLPDGNGEALTTQEVTEAPVPTATQDFGDPADDPLSGAAIYDFTEDAPDNSGLYAADASLAALGDILGEMPVITVKVEDCDIPYCDGARVYTSKEDFGSLGFIAAAAHAAGEYPDWVYRGAAQIAANGYERMLLKLGAVLDSDERINALALLPTRFSPRFNNDEALKVNYRAAGGFLQYIIEKHGKIDLGSAADDKREFIDLIGLTDKYEGLYEGLLDNCELQPIDKRPLLRRCALPHGDKERHLHALRAAIDGLPRRRAVGVAFIQAGGGQAAHARICRAARG